MNLTNPKPGIQTVEILGMSLPIIADLGDGWFLAAHPNGAAIAKTGFLSVLWTESTETTLSPTWPGDNDDSPIPESVRADAVEAFERLAWPLVREQFYGEDSAS